MNRFSNLGNQYDKPDMERLGLFSEMPFMNGKGYVPLYPKPRAEKGKNMMSEGPKIKCGRQDCYFEKGEFKRLFVGESIKGRGRKEPPPRFKNVSERPMVPPAGPKISSTPGDHYGTFSGKFTSFVDKWRAIPPAPKEPKQCFTNPGKKGGYGYLLPPIGTKPETPDNKYISGLVINKSKITTELLKLNIKYNPLRGERYGTKAVYKQYGINISGPMHATHFPQPYFDPNPYREPEKLKPGPTYVPPKEKTGNVIPPGKIIPVGPGKSQGGCHAGCFESFPEYKPNKYITLYDLAYKPKRHVGGQFYPHSMAQKTYYDTSIVAENLRFRINKGNYATYEPTYIKHLNVPP